jgi:hypothetical protein
VKAGVEIGKFTRLLMPSGELIIVIEPVAKMGGELDLPTTPQSLSISYRSVCGGTHFLWQMNG